MLRSALSCLLVACWPFLVTTAQDEGAALGGRIAELMEGHTDRRDEARILELLRGASAGALNAALAGLDLGDLLGDVDDRPWGPDHRAALIGLLSRERLADLDTTSRAAVVSALQRGRTGLEDERAIRDVILATRGTELTALKNALDRGDDHRDLHQLLFRDLDDPLVRAQIIAHVAVEGAALPRRQWKLLCDVDDTIYANWADERFPEGTVYPGLREFLFQLDLGPDGDPAAGLQAPGVGDLVILTARPGDRAGVVEQATRERLRGFGFFAFTVLAGELADLTSHEAMAAGKLENFERHRLLFPEYRYVFVGDSGQGDGVFGATLMERYPDTALAVFLHDVTDLTPEERAAWRRRGVLPFATYVGAAREAHGLGLVSTEGLSRVARLAVEELAAVRWDDDDQRLARRAELARDLERANAALPEALRVELP